MQRVGMAFSDAGYARIVELGKKMSVSHACLVESLALADDELVLKAFSQGEARRKDAMKKALEIRREASKAFKKLTPEQMQQVLKAAEQPQP